jgi:hypothetical protein
MDYYIRWNAGWWTLYDGLGVTYYRRTVNELIALVPNRSEFDIRPEPGKIP